MSENQKAAGAVLTKRQERAQRILDAAGELIQRWGYKKTAIEDIAKLAGVAKGTIYLHWKTREDLFVTLLLRESMEAARAMLERIDADPAGISLCTLVRHAIYVTMTRPLTRALFMQDVDVLGELLQEGRPDLTMLSQQKFIASQQMFDFFRAKGVLRADLSVIEQIKVYVTLVIGAIVVDQYLPAELRSSPEETTERLGRMIHETLELDEPISPAVQQELKAAWNQLVQQIMLVLEERLQVELA